MSVAGPAEDLFLAARALSLAERMMFRWPHVEGVMSRIRVSRLGEEEVDAMVVVVDFVSTITHARWRVSVSEILVIFVVIHRIVIKLDENLPSRAKRTRTIQPHQQMQMLLLIDHCNDRSLTIGRVYHIHLYYLS